MLLLEEDAPTDAATRFRADAAKLALVQHPHVARVLETGDNEHGAPYLALEFIEGTSLARRLAEGPAMTVAEAVALLCKIGEGLAAVHAVGLCHGDLEPGQVLLTHSGDEQVPHLIGFVLNRAESRVDATRLSAASLGAQRAYAAPERVRGEPASTIAADVYGFAALVYAVLGGRPPHVGADPTALLESVARGKVPSLGAVRRELTPYATLLDRALASSPAKRPDGVAAVVRGLRTAHALAKTAHAMPIPVGPRLALGKAAVSSAVPANAARTLVGRAAASSFAPTSAERLPVDRGALASVASSVPAGPTPTPAGRAAPGSAFAPRAALAGGKVVVARPAAAPPAEVLAAEPAAPPAAAPTPAPDAAAAAGASPITVELELPAAMDTLDEPRAELGRLSSIPLDDSTLELDLGPPPPTQPKPIPPPPQPLEQRAVSPTAGAVARSDAPAVPEAHADVSAVVAPPAAAPEELDRPSPPAASAAVAGSDARDLQALPAASLAPAPERGDEAVATPPSPPGASAGAEGAAPTAPAPEASDGASSVSTGASGSVAPRTAAEPSASATAAEPSASAIAAEPSASASAGTSEAATPARAPDPAPVTLGARGGPPRVPPTAPAPRDPALRASAEDRSADTDPADELSALSTPASRPRLGAFALGAAAVALLAGLGWWGLGGGTAPAPEPAPARPPPPTAVSASPPLAAPPAAVEAPPAVPPAAVEAPPAAPPVPLDPAPPSLLPEDETSPAPSEPAAAPPSPPPAAPPAAPPRPPGVRAAPRAARPAPPPARTRRPSAPAGRPTVVSDPGF